MNTATVDDISYYLSRLPDRLATEAIASRLDKSRRDRDPFYLIRDEIYEIADWKLTDKRQLPRINRNTDKLCRTVTEATFSIRNGDIGVEAAARLGTLNQLHGVGIGVASAILALVEPDRYTVIDWRGWRALFGKDHTGSFRLPEYLRYLQAVTVKAQKVGATVQRTDQALWAFDAKVNGKRS